MAATATEVSETWAPMTIDYRGAYLAGMLAAGTSKTGIIGWVDGMAPKHASPICMHMKMAQKK